MSRLQWHRSLYWRIALGLFAFLALMLAAQGALCLWMTDRIAGSMPARSPRRLAELVATDVSAAINVNANLELHSYLPEQFGEILQTFVVVMRDGRTFSNHNDVPEPLLEAVREEQRFMNERPRGFGRRGDGPGQFGGGPGGPFDAGPGHDGHHVEVNLRRLSSAVCRSAASSCCRAAPRSGESSRGLVRRWRLWRRECSASA